jgi:hypothetical protein
VEFPQVGFGVGHGCHSPHCSRWLTIVLS